MNAFGKREDRRNDHLDKESTIARQPGIAPETLNRALHERHRWPSFDTIVRVAHAARENVGYLAGERILSTEDEGGSSSSLYDLRDS